MDNNQMWNSLQPKARTQYHHTLPPIYGHHKYWNLEEWFLLYQKKAKAKEKGEQGTLPLRDDLEKPQVGKCDPMMIIGPIQERCPFSPPSSLSNQSRSRTPSPLISWTPPHEAEHRLHPRRPERGQNHLKTTISIGSWSTLYESQT